MTSFTSMHHSTYYQVMLEQGAQIDTDKDIYKFSFFPRTTNDWNRLPETTTSANIIESFRMQLSSSQAAYLCYHSDIKADNT
jgi:hypothetical protein